MDTEDQKLRALTTFRTEGHAELAAIDLETDGLDYSDPGGNIVVISWADRHGCWAADYRKFTREMKDYLYLRMCERTLTSFNVQFDGGWLWREYGWLPWEMDTFGLFRQLATESYPGQRWGLAVVEEQVLGWPQENKTQLDDKLKEFGLTKAEMYKLLDLDPDYFLYYAAIDAEAHYQACGAMAKDCEALEEAGENLVQYHIEDYMSEVEFLIEAQYRGMLVDVTMLESYRADLKKRIDAAMQAFYDSPRVADACNLLRNNVLAAHAEKEPNKHVKSGAISKAWTTWNNECDAYANMNFLNTESVNHLRWLFYEQLGNEVKKLTKGSKDPVTGKVTNRQPATDAEAMLFFGDEGELLLAAKKLSGELGFVEACYDNLRYDTSAG